MPIHGLAPSDRPTYPPHFNIEAAIRPNILALHPYRCARDDYQSGILLDANENALGHAIPAKLSTAVARSLYEAAEADINVNGNGELVAAAGGAVDAPPDVLALDLHRYPDPAQREIKARIATLRGLVNSTTGAPKDDHVFLGVGSDEVIDLLMRICAAPGPEGDRILVTPPTYGMYSVCAQVNDVGVVKVPLIVEGGAFQLDVEGMKRAIDADPRIKLVFLTSPGNPTGTLLALSDIRELLEYPNFKGIVVVDEAYTDFSPEGSSAVALVEKYANLCVSQTLSKGFGLAAIRLGVALAHPALIQILSNTKAPYNISTPTSALALAALSPSALNLWRDRLHTLNSQRAALLSALRAPELARLGLGDALGKPHANFVLVPVLRRKQQSAVPEGSEGTDARVNGHANAESDAGPDNERAERVYKELAEREGVVVRFRGREYGCTGCLRITVGSSDENRVLVQKLAEVLRRI